MKSLEQMKNPNIFTKRVLETSQEKKVTDFTQYNWKWPENRIYDIRMAQYSTGNQGAKTTWGINLSMAMTA